MMNGWMNGWKRTHQPSRTVISRGEVGGSCRFCHLWGWRLTTFQVFLIKEIISFESLLNISTDEIILLEATERPLHPVTPPNPWRTGQKAEKRRCRPPTVFASAEPEIKALSDKGVNRLQSKANQSQEKNVWQPILEKWPLYVALNVLQFFGRFPGIQSSTLHHSTPEDLLRGSSKWTNRVHW